MTENHSKLTITILGSGTCVPSLKRNASSILIKTEKSKILLDLGPGTTRRLLEAGHTIFDISYIFFSHFHPDHSGDLVPFLFSNQYPDPHKRKIPLTIVGGKGLMEFYSGLKDVYGKWVDLPPNRLKILELSNTIADALEFDGFKIDSIPVEHSKESIAYKITGANGKTIVYSGDTDYTKNLIALALNANILVCESAFPDSLKFRGHLTPSLAGDIAAKSNVDKLILTHFYPECDHIDLKKECRKTYTGPLILAEDLLTIEV